MSAPVTSFYAGLCALLLVFLAARIIAQRRAKRVDMGADGDRLLERLIRAHGNFAEYAPLGLILLALLELQGWPSWLIHVLGLALLGGRVAHAWSFSVADFRPRSRVAGMVLTLTMLGLAGLLCLLAPFL